MEDPMRVTRPTYTEEFRRDAVALLKSTDRSFTQVAEDLGVSSFSLRQWYKGADVPKKPKKPRKGEVAVASGAESPEQKLTRLERENQTLRKENDSLRMDREILKKAAAFFAKESE
jgi:transposase